MSIKRLIKKGFLVRCSILPWSRPTKEEYESFYKVGHVAGAIAYIRVPKRLIKGTDYRGGDWYWQEPGEQYLGVHFDYITRIKGYFSLN